MTCPKCGGKTKINDSRHNDDDSVKRRRECLECGYRFSTVEIDADLYERMEGKAVVEVIETKKIPENCTTCLYGRVYGCAHANRQNDWMRYVAFSWLDNNCPSFYLDHKYKTVSK